MEPTYKVRLKIGKLFLATWIPSVAHLKGWFIGCSKRGYYKVLVDWTRAV